MTHKYAEHLQKEFTDWNVDCEYNRNGKATKELRFSLGKVPSDDLHAQTVYPDIIVHCRGKQLNLLVIEAKKLGNNTGKDREKLEAFRSDEQYRYQFSALLVFVTGEQPDILIEKC